MRSWIATLCLPQCQGLVARAELARDRKLGRHLQRALRDGDLVRVRRGVYAPARLPVRGRHLIRDGVPDYAYLAQVRAALLSIRADAAAAGRTAAVLWGFDLFVEPQAVEVAVPWEGAYPSGPDLVVRRHQQVHAVEHPVLGFQAIRILTPAATVIDVALNRPKREAVVLADSALRSGLLTLEELVAAVDARRHAPGARRVRAMLDLVDPQSGSVLESLCRVLLAEHGLHPVSQLELRGAPGRIGRVDFAFPQAQLVVECDGRRWHDPDDARRKDRWRDNELARVGWRVVRVTWDEVVRSPAYVVALVRESLEVAA